MRVKNFFKLCLSASVGLTLGAAYLQAAPATMPMTPEIQSARAELTALAPELNKVYGDLEAKIRAMPRDKFDPTAIVEIIGRDVTKLADWVAAETDLLPYRGALRTSRGVLMDRAGNSMDRSLLLAELLQAAGHDVRLANATLPPEQAKALAAKVAAVRAHFPTVEMAPEAKAARERVAAHSQELIKAIGAVNPTSAAFAESLADHWWVQRREGDAWIDIDPCGVTPLPAAARNVLLKWGDPRLGLESKDCHEVTMNVVIEAYKNNKLTTEIVTQQIFRPSELLDRPVMLYHYTGANAISDSLYLADSMSKEQMKKSLTEQQVFLPVLKIGPEELMSASFDISGTVDRSPKIDGAGQLSGAAAQVFGGLAGDSGPQKKPDLLTAEWLEYEIRVPGKAPQVVRRMIFDLIGPAARASGLKQTPTFGDTEKVRRGLMLLGSTQVLIQPCEISNAFVAYQLSQAQLSEKKIWASIAAGEFSTFQDLTSKLDRLQDTDLTRVVAMSRSPLGPTSASTFIDQPNILHRRTWAELQADGSIKMHGGFDLAFTSTASLQSGAAEAFNSRLQQGIADTLAEHWGNADKKEFVENTMRLFEHAAEQKFSPVVARTAADLSALGLTPDVQARAQADIAAGNVLVIAKLQNGRSGWWKIETKSGQTVGVMDNGYHADTSEYPAVQKKGPSRAQYIREKIGKERFDKLDAKEYMRLTRDKEIPYDEWSMVEQIQGKVAQKTLTIAEQLAKGRGFIKG